MQFPNRYVHIRVGICMLVQVPVEARRGHLIPLQMVVSHHVVAGN